MHLNTPLDAMGAAEHREARNRSRFMALEAAPVSPQASSLVSSLVEMVISPFQQSQGQLRPTMVTRYPQTLGPFLADLLHAGQQGRWSSLATSNSDLTTYPGGKTAFATMRSSLLADGLLEEHRGFRIPSKKGHGPSFVAALTSFRPTAKLMNMVEGHGIDLGRLDDHFGKPAVLNGPKVKATEGWLIARAMKVEGSAPKSLPIAPDDTQAGAIVARMEMLNRHLLAPGHVNGIVFKGLKRVFNSADQPGFNWQWGGRFYSMRLSDRYESLSDGKDAGAGRRARAKVIRLDGEEVEEPDLGASHLSIMHGLLGLPFDGRTDPYNLGGPARREEVKWFITRALGKSDPDIGGKRYGWARDAALGRYPFLRDLPTLAIGTLDLQYHEAEIMMLAMEDLRDRYGIGFLPVHDALMVPVSKRDVGVEVLKGAFRRYFVETLGMADAPVPRVH